MKPQALFRRWSRRYLKLEAEQWRQLRRCRVRGNAEDIHNLRVTLRRLRLLLRVGQPAFDRPRLDEYLLWSRRVSEATSGLRDLDVATEWLTKEAASPELIEELRARRQMGWRVARKQFFPPPPMVRDDLGHPQTGSRIRSELSRRYQKRWDRLEAAVRERLENFFELPIEDRHAIRRQFRNLRYLRELQLSRKKQAGDPQLLRILRAQVSMGELQNLWIVRAMGREAIPPGQLGWVLRRVRSQERRLKGAIKAAIMALAPG